MTAQEFAALIEVLLVDADQGELSVEDQTAVLERILKALKAGLAPP